jgi:hypothetical protein
MTIHSRERFHPKLTALPICVSLLAIACHSSFFSHCALINMHSNGLFSVLQFFCLSGAMHSRAITLVRTLLKSAISPVIWIIQMSTAMTPLVALLDKVERSNVQ